jgi:AbiJ N-terminal domain 4
MLTDIFAERYANRVIWPAYSEAEKKLLMQCYRMVEELFPYWVDGKVAKGAEKQWKSIHDPLSMELGLSDLGPPLTGWSTLDQVCKNFVTASYDGTVTPDRFIKERLSFIELAFRLRGEELRDMNAELPVKTAAAELADAFKAHRSGVSGGTTAERIAAYNKSLNLNFGRSVAELNERLRRAGAPRLASLDNAIAKSGPFASTAPIPQLSTGFGPPLTSSDSNSNSPAGSDTTQFFW